MSSVVFQKKAVIEFSERALIPTGCGAAIFGISRRPWERNQLTDKTPNIAAPNRFGGIASTQHLSENPTPAQRRPQDRLFYARGPVTMKGKQIVCDPRVRIGSSTVFVIRHYGF